MQIKVKVVPNASRDKVAGRLGDAIKITTKAPPEAGKANAAVTKILAQWLGVDPRQVTLTQGQTQARKTFEVEVDAATLTERLSELG